ncbi:alpha/beta hydrolase fold domain-containing protein [Streptomyces sp. NPDC097981]|uniref:alpha/beta hydrolase fold domain-containing protein n=1 Tax=Streptomyces sp. NPDC097981 TaxID=3155428 RepID=UPI00332A2EE1
MCAVAIISSPSPAARPLLRQRRLRVRAGDEAPFPAQLHDVKAAIRYVRRFAAALGIDPDRIAVRGESAGGTWPRWPAPSAPAVRTPAVRRHWRAPTA